jgi:hypothetical protein
MKRDKWYAGCPILEMSVNGAPPISSLASWIIAGWRESITPYSVYWLPLWAQWPALILLPLSKNVRQSSVNDFWSCILDNSRPLQQATSILTILATFIGKNATDNIATTSSK